MSLQRQFNHYGMDIDEVRKIKNETGGVKRSKKPRHFKTYRSNSLTVAERIERNAHLKGFFGINPEVRMSTTKPRRKPSKYMPHSGGKGFKAPRPRQVRVAPVVNIWSLILGLKSKALEAREKFGNKRRGK